MKQFLGVVTAISLTSYAPQILASTLANKPPWEAIAWREMGPAVGGRATAVAGTVQNASLYYAGMADGGVWKTDNGGNTWEPIFDREPVASIGAIAIDPSSDNVVWVGTGESNPRSDVLPGDGIYKTTDGGKTWTNAGLAATRYISRILIDPSDPQHVIVGALGDVFADSPDRGVYVTWDGGKTWSRTLFVGPQSGVSDLAMDAQHFNIIYAGIWQLRRRPWLFASGGPQGGLYKSNDGGRSWARLSGHGLPTGYTGRIGLAIAPSGGGRIYALIESKEGVLWRSDDAGATWRMISKDTSIDERPFYFSHIAVDPRDSNRIYALSARLAVSEDAGAHFKTLADTFGDFHDMWIAPVDPDRMIIADDNGYAVTLDAGRTWSSSPMAISQIYHIGVNDENPYLVCAGLQDNFSWCGPSNSLDPSGIMNKYWFRVGGGDGQWAVPPPGASDDVWSTQANGIVEIYDRIAHDEWWRPPYMLTGRQGFQLAHDPYRFSWDAPIALAPWNAHLAWLGGNVVFATIDNGKNWAVISPDLTRDDKQHQVVSGGPITHDMAGAEYSDTILDIEGSTLRRGEIWVGTDDGFVQVTRDGGRHWHNVTPQNAPKYGQFFAVAPSTLEDGTAYASADNHLTGDDVPHLWVTRDYGKHWSSITNGLPNNEWIHTVRPDARNANVVYLGTDKGIYISFDGGRWWQSFANNMPHVAVFDIRIQPQFDDLLVATHGRSIYVMDDIRPIQELQRAIQHGTWLFEPRVAYEYTMHDNTVWTYSRYAASNPPYGVIVDFYQARQQRKPPRIEILNSAGRVIRTIWNVSNGPGLNRYVWDFTIDPAIGYNAAPEGSQVGPSIQVPPGCYSVQLTLWGKTYVRRVLVKADPRSRITEEEYKKLFSLQDDLQEHLSSVDAMLNSLHRVAGDLSSVLQKAAKMNSSVVTYDIMLAQHRNETISHALTANYQSDEDHVRRPGMVREDILYALETINALSSSNDDFVRRVISEYGAARASCVSYAASLKNLNQSLRSVGLYPMKLRC